MGNKAKDEKSKDEKRKIQIGVVQGKEDKVIQALGRIANTKAIKAGTYMFNGTQVARIDIETLASNFAIEKVVFGVDEIRQMWWFSA